MPVSPEYAEELSAGVAAHYQEAERLLLELIGRYLRNGMDAPDWAEVRLLQIQLLQAQASGILDRTAERVAAELAVALSKAANRGSALAVADLAELVRRGLAAPPPPGLPAVEALVGETLRQTVGTHPFILRQTLDMYRAVIAETSPQVLLGRLTRVQAAQAALDRFADRGIAGFIDRAGRNWALESYAEMATRTATGRAVLSGYEDKLLQAGFDLVMVSDHPQECELCRPWEGKILSISGVRRVDVQWDATTAAARAAGFQHPNCRHSLSLYQPGFTKRPTNTRDPQGDADRQQLRHLERQVRRWKRRELVALDDETAAAARVRIRNYQAKIRAHVSDTSAKRQPHRERLGAL